MHLLIKLGSKQLRASGTLVKPEDYASRSTELFAPLHDAGELAGEWGLYALIALVLAALWQGINLESSVGQGAVCVFRGAGQGVTTRNSIY